jgi:hypothetical protein
MLLLSGCAGLDVGYGNIYEGLRSREALTNTTVQAAPDVSYQEYEAARQERIRRETSAGGEAKAGNGPRWNYPTPTPGIGPPQKSVD